MKKNLIFLALSCILLPHMMVAMQRQAPAPKYTQAQLDQALQDTHENFAKAIELIRLGANPACYRVYDDDQSGYVRPPMMFGQKSDPKEVLRSLLLAVAKGGTKEQLEVLLGKGAILAPKALHVAATAGNNAVLDVLIATGMSVSEKGDGGAQAMHVAAQAGKSDVVKLLLSHKASPEATDAHGAGVLHYAAKGGSESVIKELLAANASMASIDREGAGVLHHAVENGHLHLVRPLLAAKATIDATDYKGAGVLHYAARTKNEAGAAPLIRLLMAENAAINGVAHDMINGVDFEGKTPLHEAVILKKNTAALAFIEEGADTTIKDKKGKMPLQYALENPIAKPAEARECKAGL